MLVVRFIDGLAGSAFLSVAGGTVGDVFAKNELSLPMMIYTASPMLGPELGPVAGGFINQFTDWRWSFWVLVIWSGIQWVAILVFYPETYAPVSISDSCKAAEKNTELNVCRSSCVAKQSNCERRQAMNDGKHRSRSWNGQ